MSAPLSFENLAVRYGEREILRGLSGRLEPGRLVALIGPNGSGKSTLLKTLGGLLPYEGAISLMGRELRAIPRRELGRTVGMLPQNTQMDTALTVYDLIALGRLPHEKLIAAKNRKDEAIILGSAAHMELDGLLFRSAARISGGEAQRALLAMLLAQDPDVFLLDEPSSATDIKHAALTFSLFRKMAAAHGRIVLAAVHDVNLAMRFADDAIALKDGEILAACPMAAVDGELLETLYEVPFERFVSQSGATAWHAMRHAEAGPR